jgi:putative effector of murein hydrolase LrgA (UPF0299 family)
MTGICHLAQLLLVEMGWGLMNSFQDWLQATILLIVASQVATIIGMSHCARLTQYIFTEHLIWYGTLLQARCLVKQLS